MYCIYCGKKNPDGMRFCLYCGQMIEEDAYPQNDSFSGDTRPMDAVREPVTEDAAGYKNDAFSGDTRPLGGKTDTYSGSGAGYDAAHGAKQRKFPLPAIILIIVVAAAAIFGVIYFVMLRRESINLNNYVNISLSGYDGYADYTLGFDYEALEKDHGASLQFTQSAKSALSSDTIENGPVEYMRGLISVNATSQATGDSEYAGVTNGDQVSYNITVDASLEDYVKCSLEYGTGSVTVEGLNTAPAFDPFDGLSVTFSGSNGSGRATVAYTGSQLVESSFICDHYSGLSNGDVVVVSLVQQEEGYYVRNLGVYPLSYQKTFTVSGLGSESSASAQGNTSSNSATSSATGGTRSSSGSSTSSSTGTAPEDVVTAYVSAFARALNAQDFSYVKGYLKENSEIYDEQKEYVEKGITEEVLSCEIIAVNYTDDETCLVTTKERLHDTKEGEWDQIYVQEATYSLVKEDGEWLMTSFADLEVLSREYLS